MFTAFRNGKLIIDFEAARVWGPNGKWKKVVRQSINFPFALPALGLTNCVNCGFDKLILCIKSGALELIMPASTHVDQLRVSVRDTRRQKQFSGIELIKYLKRPRN